MWSAGARDWMSHNYSMILLYYGAHFLPIVVGPTPVAALKLATSSLFHGRALNADRFLPARNSLPRNSAACAPPSLPSAQHATPPATPPPHARHERRWPSRGAASADSSARIRVCRATLRRRRDRAPARVALARPRRARAPHVGAGALGRALGAQPRLRAPGAPRVAVSLHKPHGARYPLPSRPLRRRV